MKMSDCLFNYYEKDFTKIVIELAKKPDPEFEAAADRVGTILMTMNMLGKYNPQKWYATDTPPQEQSDWTYQQLIEDEIAFAKKYWRIYGLQNDDLFRQIAKQKLAHVVALKDKAIQSGEISDKSTILELNSKHEELMKIIK